MLDYFHVLKYSEVLINHTTYMKEKNELRVLLMQIRDDEVTRLQEFMEFVQFSGLTETQITVLDVFKTPHFSPEILDDFDALFVGGSSDASVLDIKKYPFVTPGKDLMKYAYDKNIPVLASCFGFQLAVEALGGTVILDADNMEMGTYEIEIDQEFAQKDPIFKNLPKNVWAISGHRERAENLPTGAINFASTPLCPFHAITFKDKPFYAFQFHPELDKKDFIIRLERYKDRYIENAREVNRILGSLQEVDHANSILSLFIDNIALQENGK